jgi:hypothetical protein
MGGFLSIAALYNSSGNSQLKKCLTMFSYNKFVEEHIFTPRGTLTVPNVTLTLSLTLTIPTVSKSSKKNA